ncbi:MAG TPA: substrate-binding domain-containing protein [Solirubrobacterales bacterium]|jgi:ABC-type phosphate transport system substrate-binding protein|nr:substrate-binding domain-containing protein [Solirubrobacterales bacterium]
MSAFKQKLARLGATAGVLAASTAAIMGVGAVEASSALAAPECPSNAVSAIEGKGSSLQRLAQEAWTGRLVPSGEPLLAIPHELKTGGYAATCGEAPSVSYTSTSSGNGLLALRYTGEGVINNGSHEGETHTISFAGTDDGPTLAQIEHAEAATSGANALVVPVAETAISVPIHMPTGCEFQSGTGLTWSDLTKVFAGSLTHWNELETDNGNAACNAEITRVVRSDASGTSFQFKNYLSAVEGKAGAVGPGKVKIGTECVTKTWAQLRPIENAETGALNTTWPESNCNTGVTPVVTQSGGGGVASYVQANSSTIGYAALPDAKSKSAAVAPMQNLGGSTVTYANPENGTQSNCGTRQYTVPTPGREGESAIHVNWNEVFGASPAAGGTLYPLCTLTYDLSWTSYEKAGYANPAATAADVKAYINYVLGEGQTNAKYLANYYQALPTGAGKSTNVLAAAKNAASKIG